MATDASSSIHGHHNGQHLECGNATIINPDDDNDVGLLGLGLVIHPTVTMPPSLHHQWKSSSAPCNLEKSIQEQFVKLQPHEQEAVLKSYALKIGSMRGRNNMDVNSSNISPEHIQLQQIKLFERSLKQFTNNNNESKSSNTRTTTTTTSSTTATSNNKTKTTRTIIKNYDFPPFLPRCRLSLPRHAFNVFRDLSLISLEQRHEALQVCDETAFELIENTGTLATADFFITALMSFINDKNKSNKDKDSSSNNTNNNTNNSLEFVVLPLSKLKVQDNAIKTLHSQIPFQYHQQALHACDSAAMKMITSHKTIRSPTGFFIKVLQTFSQKHATTGDQEEEKGVDKAAAAAAATCNDNTLTKTKGIAAETTATAAAASVSTMTTPVSLESLPPPPSSSLSSPLTMAATTVTASSSPQTPDKGKNESKNKIDHDPNDDDVALLMPQSKFTLQDEAIKTLYSLVPLHRHGQAVCYCDAAAMKVLQRNQTIRSPTKFFIQVIKSFRKSNLDKEKTNASTSPSSSSSFDHEDNTAISRDERNAGMSDRDDTTSTTTECANTSKIKGTNVPASSSSVATPSVTASSSKSTIVKDKDKNNNIDNMNINNDDELVLPESKFTLKDNAVKTLHSLVPPNQRKQALCYCDAAAMNMIQRNRTIRSPTGFFIKTIQSFHKSNVFVNENKNVSASSTSLEKSDNTATAKRDTANNVDISTGTRNETAAATECTGTLNKQCKLHGPPLSTIGPSTASLHQTTVNDKDNNNNNNVQLIARLRRELQGTNDQLQAKSIQCEELTQQVNLSKSGATKKVQELETLVAKFEENLRIKDNTIKTMAGTIEVVQLESQKSMKILDEVRRELMFVQQEKKTFQEQHQQQQKATLLSEVKCTNMLAAKDAELEQMKQDLKSLEMLKFGIAAAPRITRDAKKLDERKKKSITNVAQREPSAATAAPASSREEKLFQPNNSVRILKRIDNGIQNSSNDNSRISSSGDSRNSSVVANETPITMTEQPIQVKHDPLQTQAPPKPTTQQPANTRDPAPHKNALTASALASIAPEMQKTMIGERLYPLIHQSQPDLAGKITGMLLEMDNSGLLHLLESPNALNLRISEALKILEAAHQTGKVCQAIQTNNGASGSRTTTGTTMQLCRLLLMGHHILDPDEVHHVQQTASKYDLGGYIKLGYPGYILVEGLADNCTFFVETVIQQHTKLPNSDLETKGANSRTDSTTFYVAGKVLTTARTGDDLDANRVFAKKKLTEIEPSREGVEMMRELCSKVDLGKYYIDST